MQRGSGTWLSCTQWWLCTYSRAAQSASSRAAMSSSVTRLVQPAITGWPPPRRTICSTGAPKSMWWPACRTTRFGQPLLSGRRRMRAGSRPLMQAATAMAMPAAAPLHNEAASAPHSAATYSPAVRRSVANSTCSVAASAWAAATSACCALPPRAVILPAALITGFRRGGITAARPLHGAGRRPTRGVARSTDAACGARLRRPPPPDHSRPGRKP